MSKHLVTIEEASKSIGLTRSHLRFLIDRGEINAVTDGDTVVLSSDEIERVRTKVAVETAELRRRFQNKEATRNGAVDELTELLP